VERLLKDYPDTDSAPMAHILSGRIALAKGHEAKDVDAALASFERVPRLFPNDEAVAAAGFFAADTLRAVRRTDEALERFRRVSMEYPRSSWAARARIGAGLCLVSSERAPVAPEERRRVRLRLPESPESADAITPNTILYRLYVRLPGQPAYAYSGRYPGTPETMKLRDVVALRFDPTGQLLLGHKLGVSVFDAKAKLARTITIDEPSTFFLDDRGRIISARKNNLTVERGETQAISIPGTDKPRLVEEIPSAVAMSDGTRLVSDRKGKQVIRLSAAGAFVGKFAGVDAERLALNHYDDVAMIDRETKSVALFDRDGKALGKITQKGTGYERDNPVDLNFDPCGNLYVVDRGRGSVVVFGPKNKLLTTVTMPEKSPGAFPRASAFALDRAGRLYIFDDRAQGVQVYQ